jgi:eukaryotic-like serine/threonine-protein kinase
MTAPVRPAANLLGHTLPSGWRVVEEADRDPTATGANFSVGYIVEDPSGQRAFLKALDFSRALRSPDPVAALRWLTTAYEYERDLLARVRGERLNRVAVALEDGQYDVDPSSPLGSVPYLIFELADGDVRKQLARFKSFDAAWGLRCLHHVAVGMNQLHSRNIAHQDLKPSNVLFFDDDLGSKVADLGCAAAKGATAPTDVREVAGDPEYAPPEFLYGQVPTEWEERHLSCDLYLFGSLFVFILTGVNMTGLLLSYLDRVQWPGSWKGRFVDVLPFLLHAFSRALADLEAKLPVESRNELMSALRELCTPDPARRGHPRNLRGANRYSLERYVALLDRLATHAERSIVGRR